METRYVSQPHAYLLRNRTETVMPEKVKGSVQTLLGQRLVADPANAVDDWTPILTPDGKPSVKRPPVSRWSVAAVMAIVPTDRP